MNCACPSANNMFAPWMCPLEKLLISIPGAFGGPSDVCPNVMPDALSTIRCAGDSGAGNNHAFVTAPTHDAGPQRNDRSPAIIVLLVPSVMSLIAILLLRNKIPSPSTPGSDTPNTPT